MNWIATWVNVVTKPTETFEAEKSNASLSAGAIQCAVAGALVGFLFGVLIAFLANFIPISGNTAMFKVIGFAAIVILPVVFAAGMVFSWLSTSVLYWLIARLFGGAGDFTQQFYLTSLALVPVVLLSTVLSFIPVLGTLAGLLVWLYGFYLLALVLKTVHGFGTGKALIVVLVPIVLSLILVAVFMLLIFGSFSQPSPQAWITSR